MFILNYIKNNILKCISFVLLVILVAGFAGFMTTPAGKKLFDELLSNFPFASLIYKHYCSITGNEIESKVITEHVFFVDAITTFSSAIFKCVIMHKAAKIFLYVPTLVNQIISSRRDTADIIEGSTKSPWYTIKYAVVAAIVTLIADYLGNIFMGWADKIIAKHHIFLLLIFAGLYVLFSIIRARYAKIPVKDSLKVSFFFNVLPSSAALLGTTSLILYAHYSYKDNGFNWLTILLWIILLAWCAVSELLCNEFRRRCVGLYMNKKSSESKYPIRLSVFFASAFFYSLYSVMFTLGMNGQDFQNKFMKIAFNVADLPFIKLVGNGFKAFSAYEAFRAWVYPSIDKLLLFALVLVFIQMLCSQRSLIAWYFMECSLLFTLTLLAYSLLLYVIGLIPTIFVLAAIIVLITILFFSKISFWRKALECMLACAGVFVSIVLMTLISNLPKAVMFLGLSVYLLALLIAFAIVGLLENRRA